MDETLKRAIAQLEQASSGSMAPYRGQLATVIAAARKCADLADENYQLRQAGPVLASDEQLSEVEQLVAESPGAYEVVRQAINTHEGIYMSSRVAKRLIGVLDAAPSLIARVRKADETTDTYAKLLQEREVSHA